MSADGGRLAGTLPAAGAGAAAGAAGAGAAQGLGGAGPGDCPRTLPPGGDFLQVLLEDSPAYFVALDPQLRVIEMNPAMLRATGYGAQEVRGAEYLERFCHPGDRERLQAAFRRMLAQAAPVSMENRLLTRAGEELAVQWQGRAVRDAQGRARLLFGLGLDISLQRKALRALEESEHTFRSIVENAHAAMTISDERGRFLYVNPEYCRLVDRPPDELIGTRLQESLRGVFDPPAIRLLGERLQAGQSAPACCTLSTRYRGGEARWYEVRSSPLRLPGGETRAVAQLLDITGEAQARRAIEQSAQKYRALFQSAPLGILSVDGEGRILEINRKMLEVLGCPGEEEARRENVRSLPLLAGIAEELARCFQGGGARVLDSPCSGARGRPSHLRYHLTPLEVEGGRVVQAIVEDITEQKRLEQQVAESQKMEALGTLSGGIAHEFNNLLQVIQGYAEILAMRRGLSPGELEQVGEIQSAARRAAELTHQLLTFGRKLESVLQPLDLNQEVGAAARLLRVGDLRGVELELELGRGLPPVLADAAQLRQVLGNLALNSVEARARRVRIRTAEGEAGREGARLHLAFEDDGQGIAPEALKSVFDPFYSTKPLGEGAGLGLSVVYGIVHNHGGRIECRSRLGEGTTFDLYLPAAPARPEAAAPAPGPVAFGQRRGGRILLVDDEPTLRRLGRDFLSGSGFRVEVAGDCEQALQLFARRPAEVDLVILDLILPGRGGEWGLEQILRLRPEQKVLVTSGQSLTATVGAMLRAGASGFIHKPYHLAELLATVRDILGTAA